jgi:hypothetical protein
MKKSLKEILAECLKEGMEVTIYNQGDGIEVSCRAIGAVTFGAAAKGTVAGMEDVILDAKEALKRALTKR